MSNNIAALASVLLIGSSQMAFASEFNAPWRESNSVIIIDPYHLNDLNFDQLAKDKKVVAIIHQATQGLNVDVKYSDRRTEALKRNILCGSYHLLTIDDVEQQINLYLDTVGKHDNETYAIDIECLITGSGLNPDGTAQCKPKFSGVTIEQTLSAVALFKKKTGTFPLLYMNDSVTSGMKAAFASNPDEYKSLRIWYARFKTDISDVFPDGIWNTYTLWQFSSELTCTPSPGDCAYRVPGADYKMDVNVYFGTEEQLRRNWPLNTSPNLR